MMQKVILSLALVFSFFQGFGQDVKKDFKTSSVAIFKNGTAFFIKSGQVKPQNKVYRITENIPPALFGTFWVNTPDQNISSLSSYVDTLTNEKKVLANSMAEMLKSNQGKKVKLLLRQEGEALEGTVQQVEKIAAKQLSKTPKYIINFRTANRWISLSASDIRQIEFLEKPNQSYQVQEQTVKPILQVDFKTQKSTSDLNMMYLSNGLSWTPMYLIELLDEETAQLSLRAEVVNDVEDIEQTEVNFVVGVPNFSYATSLSALTNFSKIKRNNRQDNRFANFSNGFTSQTYGISAPTSVSANAAPTVEGIEGSSAEDLYFYTLKNMTLPKGGRGHYPIFTAKVKIAHIYETNLPQNNQNKQAYRSEYLFSPNPNKVFHSIKVNNNTSYPFTTGPALVVSKKESTKPISQDRLNYTSIEDHSFVKLTEAPDVRIKQGEKVVEKEENAKRVGRGSSSYTYDLLTIEGQIKINNYKNKSIDLNVRRAIIGKLLKSNVKWLKAERINSYGEVNTVTDVCWETKLKAGEELQIEYSYQIYVVH